MTLGYALEALGFAAAALGLWQTWRQHVDWRHLLGGLGRMISGSTPEPAQMGLQGVLQRPVAHFEVQAMASVDADATLAQQVDQLRVAVDQEVGGRMRADREAAEQVKREAQEQARAFGEFVEAMETDVALLRSAATESTLKGLPLAVAGWVAASAGFVIQAIATASQQG